MKITIALFMSFALCIISDKSYSQTTDDVGIESVISPANGSTLSLNNSYTVTVVIKNYGSSTVTQIPVQFAVGTNSPLTGTCTAFIPAGDTAHFTFQNQLTVTNTTIGTGTVYTSLGTDVNSSNDQLGLNYNYGTTFIKETNNSTNFTIHNAINQNTINLILDRTQQAHTLEIYNLAGKLLIKQKINLGCTQKEINISSLTNGTYIVKLESTNGTSAKKFIK